MSLESPDKSFAQSDDDSKTNVIGQFGDDNKASQSESSSQKTNQNSMCVSGESNSLGCNSLSSQHQGGVNTLFPRVGGEYYTKENTEKINANDPSINSASASCESGDRAVGGGFETTLSKGDLVKAILTKSIPIGNPPTGWEIELATNSNLLFEADLTVYVVCVDTNFT